MWEVVANKKGTYDLICDGEIIKGGFTSEEQGWKWLDQYTYDKPPEKEDE